MIATSIDDFLGYAVKVEEDAALHFDDIAAAMEDMRKPTRSPSSFAQLARLFPLALGRGEATRPGAIDADSDGSARLCLAGSRDSGARRLCWPAIRTLSRLDALRAALRAKRAATSSTYAVAARRAVAEVREPRTEFVKEEAEHVAVLEAWITREEWAA